MSELPEDLEETPPSPDESANEPKHDLRGTFIFVLLMAAFFALTWFGVFAIAMERR